MSLAARRRSLRLTGSLVAIAWCAGWIFISTAAGAITN